MKLFHVTEHKDARSILREGFQGGWGDVGFGVYFYSCLYDAQDYLGRGGWDARLADPVILEIEAEASEIEPVTPHPDWDASDYENMCWHEMDPDDAAAAWQPAAVRILGEAPGARRRSAAR